ncbi:HAD-IB family hydrolase [Vibrio sp. T187]|uniref:HAD family hydrolase n=1 Tax=Vibrio TaxID=662 RepID=UPI0010C9E258|nr:MULTISPECIES: HAD-IB family hydrolase [Vibrio]MBW3698477.1 HAD-IB family hydrolase [Vibrio sp. T187]
MTKQLIIFDLDKTLISVDSISLWNAYLLKNQLINDSTFITRNDEFIQSYHKGELNLNDYIEFCMQPLAHISVDRISQMAQQFANTMIVDKVFPSAKNLIKDLNSDPSITLLIISASPSFLVKHIARMLNIEHYIGTDIMVNEGCYAPLISGTASFKEGKVTRLKGWLTSTNVHFAETHFYTDSYNDLPLLLDADKAYAVNPCPQLTAHATTANWPILTWELTP